MEAELPTMKNKPYVTYSAVVGGPVYALESRPVHCDGALLHLCLFPPVLCRRHSLEHHISPHLGQQGKLFPSLPQDAHAVRTLNFDASSRASRMGRRALLYSTGDVVLE